MTHHTSTGFAGILLAGMLTLSACATDAVPAAPAPNAAGLPLTAQQAERIREHNLHTGIPRVIASDPSCATVVERTPRPGKFALRAE